ncbi:MAG: hypothetical protein FJ100_11260 [Deltaproteobacteria bacterium]|nr:hypothetical protein [Deltaproteobacteria bacterium]
MPAKRLRPEGSVAHWLEVFELAVHECAEHRAGRSDVFLWNARKAQEAVLYALGHDADPAVWDGVHEYGGWSCDRLADRLAAKNLLHQGIRKQLDSIRWAGNLGTHVQSPSSPVDQTTLEVCRSAIVHTAQWLYDKSALQRDMPQRLQDALRDLEASAPRTPPEQRAQAEIDDLRRQFDRAEAARQALAEVVADAEGSKAVQRNVLRMRRAAAGWRLSSIVLAAVACVLAAMWWDAGRRPTCGPAATATAAVATATAVAMAPAAGGAAPVAVEAVAPDATKPGVAAVAGSTASEVGAQAPEPVRPVPRASSPVVGADPGTPAAAADSAGSAPDPAAADPPGRAASPALAGPSCQQGAVLVPAKMLRFSRGPYPRPKWPTAAGPPKAVEVPAFCMEVAPATDAAWAAWLLKSGTPATPAAPPTEGELASTRVWASSDGWCRSRGGLLPTVAQYEAWLAAVGGDIRLGWEWADDTFPPVLFGYAAGPPCTKSRCARMLHGGVLGKRYVGDPRLAWHHGGEGLTQRSVVRVRCAWPVIP